MGIKGKLVFLSLLIVAFCPRSGYGKLYGQAYLDSLRLELPRAKEDTNKVKLLHLLSFNHWNINPDEGVKYGEQTLELATKLGWKKGIAMACNDLGTNYKYKAEYDKALEYYDKALKLHEEEHNKRGVAGVLGNMGLIYENKAQYFKALEYYQQSLTALQELGDKKAVATVNGNIGNFYFYISDYAKALEYYFKSLKLSEAAGDKGSIVIYTGNIGLVYATKKDHTKALEFFMKALKLNEEEGDKNGMARVLEQAGGVYAAQGDHLKALEHCYRALQINKEINNRQGEAATLVSIGTIFREMKNYPLAIAYERAALKINTEIGDKHQLAVSLLDLGTTYVALAEYTGTAASTTAAISELPAGGYSPAVSIPAGKQARAQIAIGYLQQAADTAIQIQIPDVLKSCYEQLAEAYRITGDHRRAMEYYRNYTAMKDSIFSEENEKQVIRANMQYEFDRKHQADSIVNAEKTKIADLKLQKQRGYTYVGIAGVLLLVVFSFVILKNSRLLGVEKERSDSLLLNILPTEVAQELKTKGSAAARKYDNITVLFTDFVNFTDAGEKMTPEALIDELHVCFKAFDEITAKYNIEKIKTIGDAYLAAAGLPMPDDNHAENALKAAIDIRDFMDKRYARLGDKTFEVRIGIHSGSVVAGIVGVKKFAYDIWGDTVNTAARMEQHSEPGKINISETTHELIKDKFHCTYRGEIVAKHKGSLKMYFVS